jgi:hypothetical protein
MPGPVQEMEPLLAENPDRFCMFPIKHADVWEMYKKAEASFWTGEPARRTHAGPSRVLPFQNLMLYIPLQVLSGVRCKMSLRLWSI